MAASPSEALARSGAAYQDVLDAPEHLVAEIVDGTGQRQLFLPLATIGIAGP